MYIYNVQFDCKSRWPSPGRSHGRVDVQGLASDEDAALRSATACLDVSRSAQIAAMVPWGAHRRDDIRVRRPAPHGGKSGGAHALTLAPRVVPNPIACQRGMHQWGNSIVVITRNELAARIAPPDFRLRLASPCSERPPATDAAAAMITDDGD
jgi:hypothetical protein